jgi:hypothetical protein
MQKKWARAEEKGRIRHPATPEGVRFIHICLAHAAASDFMNPAIISFFIFLLLAIGPTVPAHAQSSETATSAYCASGSAALALGSASTTNRLVELSQKCRPGDTIFLPIANPSVIAKICDFSRAIVSTGYDVVCVLTEVRRDR